MDLILRAMAKSKAEAAPNHNHVADEGHVIGFDRAPRLITRDTSVIELNPKTLEANRIIAWNKQDPRTPAFDILRTKVVRKMESRGWTTLAITSATEACGKTTVAINLAFSLAHQMPSEVVLVDFDLRRPQIGAYLGIESEEGLASFLEGRDPLETHMVAAGGAQLRAVISRGTRRNASELLVKAHIDQLIGNLPGERASRIGIFDLPPLLATDDALAILPRIDCALVVVGERMTRKGDISAALNLLSGTNLLGVVLNRSRAKLRAYY
ncbi:CpsD/CapB family tyrosine-protein kinase [Thioalkalicoccus limnaeus]|uniref:CpsD/CapB family tyrosine-protein kinase n=1 Tax=Thioalkalicoccus limnaeus TaxID=120681 RepID=A0ABV4BE88_9GAMM